MKSCAIVNITFCAASLLVEDVLAKSAHQLGHKNRRNVIETVCSAIFITNGVPPVSQPPTPTPSTISTTSVAVTLSDITPVGTLTSPASTTLTSLTLTSAQIATEVDKSLSVIPTALATIAYSSTSITVPPSTKSSSSAKRGLVYNSANLLSGFSGFSQISWAYNWASSSAGLDLAGVEYVPLLWGLSYELTSVWAINAQSAIDSGSHYLMSFNEPDLPTQSNIGFADAAANWLIYMEPFATKVKLISPAVTNGNTPMGLTYLENFISACSTCTIHAANIHWYDSATNIDYFKNYIAEAYTASGNRPLWISELGVYGSDDEILTFLETVLPWLDEQDHVEKYAYFMASEGILLTSGTTLSTIGRAYASTI